MWDSGASLFLLEHKGKIQSVLNNTSLSSTDLCWATASHWVTANCAELHRSLLSYSVSLSYSKLHWAPPIFAELQRSHWVTANFAELHRSLLSYRDLTELQQHFAELHRSLLSYSVSLSYSKLRWAPPIFAELQRSHWVTATLRWAPQIFAELQRSYWVTAAFRWAPQIFAELQRLTELQQPTDLHLRPTMRKNAEVLVH